MTVKGFYVADFPRGSNWELSMKAKLALLTAFCVVMTGCATVDLANMTAPTASAAEAKVEKTNVVKRAASKLYAAFTTKGWVTKISRKRVQSAASVLLRGLDSESEDGPLNGYAANAGSLADIKSDIYTAQQHVEQTTKAAEVYLEISPDAANLREELASLQKALITSRQAELVFASAIEARSTNDDTTLREYSQTVDRLRDVTDAFGDRVRLTRTLTSALDYPIN